MTEQQMREMTVPYLETINDLVKYIQTLQQMDHDYGTCVYAMSMASQATFNFMARNLGVTGFQASCADLDFLRRTRLMKGPFMIIDLDKALYPQYDLHDDLDNFIHSNIGWVREQASEHLAEEAAKEKGFAADRVVEHWKALVAQTEE